jgi:alcohol dehydrogenase class IV
VGRGQALTHPALPFVAIPTTAGTGSEVTRNAVLGVPESQVKASLRGPQLLPRLAIVDPALLEGAPPEVLASSGLDALSQLIEPWLSARANPLTDALAREGIRRSVRSLRRAVLETPDAAAREDLALASLLGGLCLANAGLGAVHGFAAPLGGMFEAPHGAVCAALLPACLEVNLRALRSRAPDHPSLARFGELAGLLTGRAEASGGRHHLGARAVRGPARTRTETLRSHRDGRAPIGAQGPRREQHEGQSAAPHGRGADGDRPALVLS